jgi:hypothetical protein
MCSVSMLRVSYTSIETIGFHTTEEEYLIERFTLSKEWVWTQTVFKPIVTRGRVRINVSLITAFGDSYKMYRHVVYPGAS